MYLKNKFKKPIKIFFFFTFLSLLFFFIINNKWDYILYSTELSIIIYFLNNKEEKHQLFSQISFIFFISTSLILLTPFLILENKDLFSNILSLIEKSKLNIISVSLTSIFVFIKNIKMEFENKKSKISIIDEKILLILIILIGLIIRLNNINLLSFWYDESISILVSKRFYDGFGMTILDGTAYTRAFFYHAILSLSFLSENHWSEIIRIINLPFFIINTIIVYKIGKNLKNKNTGLLASLFFTLSWVSISIFREIRFYEISLSFFLSVILLISDFNNDIKNIKIKNIFYFIILLYFAFLLHPINMIVFYITFIYGIVLILKKELRNGLILSGGSFITVLIGMFYLYKKTFPFTEKFNFLYLINIPKPDWAKTDIVNIFDTGTSLIKTGMIFIPISFLMFFLILKYSKNTNKKNLLFIATCSAVTYFFIALQGYDINAIRYYYALIPLSSILFAFSFFELKEILSFNNKKFPLIYIIILVALIPLIISGIKESNSPIYKNSNNIMKNFDYHKMFESIKKDIDANTHTIITDQQISIPFYLYHNEKPDFIFYDEDMVKNDKNDRYLNIENIQYSDIEKKSKNNIIILLYMRTQISNNTLNDLNTNYSRIYEDKQILVYKN